MFALVVQAPADHLQVDRLDVRARPESDFVRLLNPHLPQLVDQLRRRLRGELHTGVGDRHLHRLTRRLFAEEVEAEALAHAVGQVARERLKRA
jgi:hypothetical protein